MEIANPQLEKFQNFREDVQSPDMNAKLDIMRESNIPQGLSNIAMSRPKPRPLIPVPIPQSRSQMAMAPQSGQMPVAQPPRPQMQVDPNYPVSREMTEEEFNFGNMLREVAPLALSVVVDKAIEGTDTKETIEIQQARNENQPDPMQMAMSGIQQIGVPALQNNGIKVDSTFEEDIENGGLSRMAANGGLIEMARGGDFRGRVPGDGHGMEDNVFMPIQEGPEQVGTLAVSPKEYVVDAHTMSALGNGNADKGADVMDKVVENVRHQAYGTIKQPREINGLAALRPMTERV
jgi:hypothetical protein